MENHIQFLISVGSYERTIYGLDVTIGPEKEFTEKLAFAIPAHTGYIKSIASCPKFLVSGGTDEVIRIFDLKKRKDIGSINQHDGSIRALDFYQSSHMLSAAEDGKLALFRTKDWECLHLFQKHKKPIHDMKIHPSGKLAISIDEDKNLTLWNLVTGKMTYSSKIPALGKIDRIVWSETGEYYALLGETHLLVYETKTSKKVVDLRAATLIGKVRSEKWLTAAFVHDQALLFAGESGRLHMINMACPEERFCVETGHKPRIRAISFFNPTSEHDLLITASSDGLINVFDWSTLASTMKPAHSLSSQGEDQLPKPLLQHNSELRITCLTVTLQQV